MRRLLFSLCLSIASAVALAGSGATGIPSFLQAGTGAVARTLNDKARDVVSVKDFGARCDATTDDAAAIQAAIDAVSTAGGVVNLPPATCKIASRLVMKSKVWLRGAGMNASILAPTAAASPAIVSAAYAVEMAGGDGMPLGIGYAQISDLQINLPEAVNVEGISFVGMQRSVFRNIRISMSATFAGQRGITMNSPSQIGAGGSSVFYNRFENIFMEGLNRLAGSYGYYLSHYGMGNFVTSTYIAGGHVQGLETAIRLNKGNNIWFDSVVTEDCTTCYVIGRDPEASYGRAQFVTISNPYIEDAYDGINVAAGAQRVTITGGFGTAITGTRLSMPPGQGHSVIGFTDTNRVYSGSLGKFLIDNPLGTTNPPEIRGSNAALLFSEDSGAGMDITIRNAQSAGAVNGGFQGLIGAAELFRFGTVVSAIQASKLTTDSGNHFIQWDAGSPEGVVSAKVGSIYLRTNGGAGTTFYVKESGDGTNTGWIAK